MRCKQARRLISAHLEGELSPAREERFGAHLLSCSNCEAMLTKVSNTIAVLGALPEQSLDPEKVALIQRSWKSGWKGLHEGGKPAFRGLARTATALGAVMVLGAAVAISFSVVRHPQEASENGAATETIAENETGPDGSTPYTPYPGSSAGMTTGQRPLPQVVNSARAVGTADMPGYQADSAQKESFYSAVWQPSTVQALPDTTRAYDLEELGKLQVQCAEDMIQAAQGLGEDAAGLRGVLNTVLAASTNQVPLLPCWAEKVVFEGKAAWIISLSGPDETVSRLAGTDSQVVEVPLPGSEEAVPSDRQTSTSLPRYLFVVDAQDFQILFR